jgi:hypothetical protein
MADFDDIKSAYKDASNRFDTNVYKIEKSTRKFQKRNRKGSIISSAKNNIFEFPVFVSSSVPLDYATATTSLLEQVYASYLQMAISINPVIDAASTINGTQFSGLKSNTNKYLEYTDMMYAHDACHAVYKNADDIITEFNLLSIEDSDAKIINEYCNYSPLSEFDHFFQEFSNTTGNGKKGPRNTTTNSNQANTRDEDITHDINVARLKKLERENSDEELKYEKKRRELADTLAAANRALANEQRRVAQHNDARAQALHKSELTKLEHEKDLAKKKLDDYEADHEKSQQKMQKEINRLTQQIDHANKEEIRALSAEQRDIEKHKFDIRTRAPQLLDETKIQKLNTMKPLMMSVSFNVMDNAGHLSSPVEYIVGVKTHSRIVDADTLPEVAQYPLKEMNELTRKAKWRAGELKFFKDILFRVKQKKQTAIDSRDPKRKWYRRLYELAHMKGDGPAAAVISGQSLIASLFWDRYGRANVSNGVIPNTTMIISKADVDIVKSKTGIDFLNGKTVTKFCKELFLMSFVVIDNDSESIKILLPDLHNDFEVHSLASVNKQLATLDTAGTKTRDMFKLLG